MKARFIAQPLIALGGRTAAWLLETLRDPNIVRLDLAVAWMKRSGLARFKDDFVAFHRRGGVASAILGIDEGGATVQGLRVANELFDSVHVYYEPGRRTFHPKVYLASGAESASLLVASSNLTAGGLFSNYEAALACELEFDHEEDRKLLAEVQEWFKALYSDSGLCLPLTDELLASLVTDERYKVADEDRWKRARSTGADDYDGVAVANTHELFGRSILQRAPLPPPLRPSKGAPRAAKGRPAPAQMRPATRVKAPPRWWKQLARADAQQPNRQNTSVTAVLRLSKAQHGIDSQTYFRYVLFRAAKWETVEARGVQRDKALITFDVVVDEVDLGEVQMVVDHAPHREARQHNIVTLIHWGPVLGPRLRRTDFTGAWVLLEALPAGRFRLTITRTEPKFRGGNPKKV